MTVCGVIVHRYACLHGDWKVKWQIFRGFECCVSFCIVELKPCRRGDDADHAKREWASLYEYVYNTNKRTTERLTWLAVPSCDKKTQLDIVLYEVLIHIYSFMELNLVQR